VGARDERLGLLAEGSGKFCKGIEIINGKRCRREPGDAKKSGERGVRSG